MPPHQAVACAACHIAPGATGWLKAKMNGTRQLMGVMFNNYPRPIESAMENNRLVSSAETCEQCHAREKAISPRLRVIPSFKDDEANTRTKTVLLMHIGGGTVAAFTERTWVRAFTSVTRPPTKSARPSLGWNTPTRDAALREPISRRVSTADSVRSLAHF